MAGIFLVIMGFCRLGTLIKFIPYTITTGFTAGIAVGIFAGQIKDFLGLDMESVPSEFIEKIEKETNVPVTIIGTGECESDIVDLRK